MKYSHAARDLGFKKDYFTVMKCQQRPKFDYIQSIDTNLYKAHNKYMEEMINIKHIVTNIYYELQDIKKLSHFSRYLVDQKITNSNFWFISVVPGVLFNSITGFGKHSTFIKMKKVIAAYEKYKESK